MVERFCEFCKKSFVAPRRSARFCSNPCLKKSKKERREAEGTFRYRIKGLNLYFTQAEYEQKLRSQNGGCAICGNKENSSGRRFNVDHCHETQKIRGLLCSNCNPGLGYFKDNPELLQRAIDYLLKHRE